MVGVPLSKPPSARKRQTDRNSSGREAVARARATGRGELLAVAIAHRQGREGRRADRDRRVDGDRVRQAAGCVDAIGNRDDHRERRGRAGRAAQQPHVAQRQSCRHTGSREAVARARATESR